RPRPGPEAGDVRADLRRKIVRAHAQTRRARRTAGALRSLRLPQRLCVRIRFAPYRQTGSFVMLSRRSVIAGAFAGLGTGALAPAEEKAPRMGRSPAGTPSRLPSWKPCWSSRVR